MKSFILLFCATVFSFTPVKILSQEALINIDADKKASVDEVLSLVMSQTNYVFVYHSDLFKNLPEVSLKKGVIKANQLLDLSLVTSDFDYLYDNKNTIIFRERQADDQELVITGTVIDENGVPIPGLTVYISNVEPEDPQGFKGDFIIRGTVTDLDGRFTVRGDTGHFLVITGVGYESYTQQIDEDMDQLEISLKQELNALNEIMVVGYGTTRKKDLTGTVGSVDAEEIQQIKTQTLDQALVGRVAGVYVQNRSGQPGAGALVQVRGLSQIRGDNQPLYVIDGVPVNITPNTESLGLINFGNRENPLLSIDPQNIERVDILKDASATAIYGSRAANGVIIVTTKRGNRNQAPRFSFNVSSTIQNTIDTYDYLSAPDYIDWAIGSAQLTLDPYPESFWELYFPNQYQIVTDPDSYFGTADTDWQDLITRKNALWTQYSFNVSGGSEKVNYFSSLGISDQDGVMIDNNFKR